MAKKRNELCLGYLTGICPYDSCEGKTPPACNPPLCKDMEIRSKTVFCKALNKTVDPWDYCMKCNPKNNTID